MKTLNYFVLCLTTLGCLPVFAQQPLPQPSGPGAPGTPGPAPGFQTRLQKIVGSATPADSPALTKFDLDFRGGTPRQLATAIEKAMGRPLNVIVPDEFADIKLPALKMNGVDVSQLFHALEAASQKSEAYVSSTFPQSSYAIASTGYGFRTQGKISDDSVWYFSVEKPALPPLAPVSPDKVCRYYSLATYLERGMSVDDITTAIQTGWKMLGDKETPAISFHKDTKLLIAVGEPNKLEMINAVLGALTLPPKPLARAAVEKPEAKSPQKPKTDH